MQYTVYKSSDGSAPVLSGTAGSLVALLDAILVTGYTGKAAAGWEKAFTGTNKAAYRAAVGNRRYLRVQDDAPGAAGAQEARVTGYDSMTDVDTGVNPFPTAAQGLAGTIAALAVRKSATANATARTWVCFASARAFMLFINSEGTSTYISDMYFGDFYSTKTVASTSNTLLIARTSENSAVGTVSRLDQIQGATAVVTGHFAPYSYTGTGASLAVGKGGIGMTATNMAGLLPYPNTADSAVYLLPIWVHQITPSVRIGRLPGFWFFDHTQATAPPDGSTFSGSGPLAGKTFYVLQPTANTGIIVIETSDTLEAN